MTRYEPYKEGDKWYLDVDRDDEVNYVANVFKWLNDNATETADFTALPVGCTLMKKSQPQGERNSLLPVKLKVSFDVDDPHCTFRVDTEDDQQFDKTIWFREAVN